jgi:plastocyanin
MRAKQWSARALIALVATLAILWGTACGGSSSPSNSPASAPGGESGATVKQGVGGFVFTPAKLSVKKGTTITVTNAGDTAHTFTIDGKGIDLVNDPGKSGTVTIDLDPGTYPFICRFHVSFGMKGTLTVTA